MLVVGLAGRPQSGRTTIARYLVSEYGFSSLHIGLYADGERCALTPSQHALAMLSFAPLIKIHEKLGAPGVVIPDVEDTLEAQWIREQPGGLVCHVVRPGFLNGARLSGIVTPWHIRGPARDQVGIVPKAPDRGIVNDGTLGELANRVDAIMDSRPWSGS